MAGDLGVNLKVVSHESESNCMAIDAASSALAALMRISPRRAILTT